MRIFTDASTQGWGAHFGSSTCQGTWSLDESRLHINMLEMWVVRLALVHLQLQQGDNILVATGNSSVVAYVNRQGGTRSRLL